MWLEKASLMRSDFECTERARGGEPELSRERTEWLEGWLLGRLGRNERKEGQRAGER